MALPEDIVLYDLEDTDDVDALIRMSRDPETRWFARARLASLSVKGMVGATWNPALHPRGRDGRFIHKFGWVRWLVGTEWRSGQVANIDPKTGDITILSDPPPGKAWGPVKTTFSAEKAADVLFSHAAPKGTLDLPDPKAGKDVPGWEKIGGQGGSNPGGMYKVADLFGDSRTLPDEQFQAIVEKFDLNQSESGEPLSVDVPVIGRAIDGTVWFSTDSKSTLFGVDGKSDPPVSGGWEWYYGPNAAKAWKEISTAAQALRDGDKIYVKTAKSPEHARNEVLANRLYELAGVNVPETILGNDGITVASRLVPFDESKINIGEAVANDPEAMARLRKDFAIDAWLANWDVAGLGLENTQVVDGYPYRIDAGGALLYRAQGGPKGANFGPNVGELDTLRDKSMNAAAATVFGDVTDADIKDGVERIAAISPEMIKAQVFAADLPDSLADTLIARRAYLLGYTGIEDPFVGKLEDLLPEPEPEEAQVPAPTSGKSKVWSGVDQTWVDGVPTSESQALDELAKQYEADYFFDTDIGNIADIAGGATTPNAGVYFLFDGSLWKFDKKNYDIGGMDPLTSVTMTKVSTGEQDSRLVPTGLSMKTMVVIAPNGLMKQAVENIKAAEQKLADVKITHLSTKGSLDELLFEPPQFFESDLPLPHAPEFVTHSASVYSASAQIHLSVNGKAPKYLYDSDKGRLYQVIERYYNDIGQAVTVMDPITGEVVSTPDVYPGQELIYVDQDDDFSLEVMEAYIQLQKSAQPGPAADKSDLDLAGEVLAQLAQMGPAAEAAEVEDVTPVVELNKPPADAKIKASDAYYALNAAMIAAGYSDDSWSATMNEFLSTFGTDGPDAQVAIPYEVLEGYIDDGLIEEFDSWLLTHATYIEEPGDLPDITDVLPVDNPSGLHPDLVLDEGFNFSEIDSGDGRLAKAQSLVGKVVLLSLVDPFSEENEGSITLGKVKGKTPIATLVFVEDLQVQSGNYHQLVLRLSNGAQQHLSIPMPGQYESPSFKTSTFWPVDSLTVNDLKGAASPTVKADGTIVYAGQVVGAWEQDGEAYWNQKFNYTLNAEHTLFGKPITGSVSMKTGIKAQASFLLMPKSMPTKSKKESAASAKIEAAVKAIETDIPGGLYKSGEQAKLGDWVAATKGGGGFVGKIVGWPNQEQYPDLAFAVSQDGIQKAIKLSTHKKVANPDAAQDQVISELVTNLSILPDALPVPSAYTEHKLADGKTPLVGMKVEAGKPGSKKVVGIITGMNITQGWVYIQTPDGKNVSKTMNVTTVLEEPDLIWDADAHVAIAALDTKTTTTAPKPKIGKANYPGPDGALIDQAEALKTEWLDANPKRKLTKDGFAPSPGMRVRNNKGEALLITAVAGAWDANPNKVSVYNLAKASFGTTSTTSIEVDHEAELTAFDSNLIKKVALGAGAAGGAGLPNGTVIYRHSAHWHWYSKTSGNDRTLQDWYYLAITPTGSVRRLQSNYQGDPVWAVTSLKDLFKYSPPEHLEKVAVLDDESSEQILLKPVVGKSWGENPGYKPSSIGFAKVGAEVDTPVEPEPKPEPKPKPEPAITPIVDEAEIETEQVITPDAEPVDPPEGEVQPPKIVDSASITTLAPPPNPTPAAKAKKVDPDLPVVTGQGADFGSLHSFIDGGSAMSIAQAAAKMIEQKDSTAPGSAITYSMGDSDYIEDMAIRFQVEKSPDGTERLIARLRLREDVSEAMAARVMTTGEGKTGAWKLKGTTFAKSLKDGDLINVYLSGTTKLLKPRADENLEPNARVIGTPKYVGTSKSEASLKRDVPYDLYRVTVQMADGSLGEVDMEQREGGSIATFEYDHDAPAKTGGSLNMTATALADGWSRQGNITMPGSQGQFLLDDTGKVIWSGNVGSLAKGTGGHHLVKTMPDGARIQFNTAHSSEGGTGFDTTRRANAAGEVRVSIPLFDGRPLDDILASFSQSLEAVGVPVEKQGPPTDEQLVTFALNRLVTNYHPKYEYRMKPVLSADDPRVKQTLDHMNAKLQKHLGRNVTLADVRFHTYPNGRVSVVFTPEVAKAIMKASGTQHYTHHGVGSPTTILSSTANGLLSTDERWSMGVMTTGMSSHADMGIGSGDRLYMRSVPNNSYSQGNVVLNALATTINLDFYTKGVGDNYGRRSSENKTMDHHHGGWEWMLKRRIEAEQITFYIVNEHYKADYIQKLKEAGVTHIAGRPVDQIIVTASEAKAMKNFEDIGTELYADDKPLTELLGETT